MGEPLGGSESELLAKKFDRRMSTTKAARVNFETALNILPGDVDYEEIGCCPLAEQCPAGIVWMKFRLWTGSGRALVQA